jgi:hypothetical protein
MLAGVPWSITLLRALSRVRALVVVAALAALIGAPLSAGEPAATAVTAAPVVAPPAAAAPLPSAPELWQWLNAQPAWLGPVLVLVGMVPLFAGWRLIRWTTAVIAAGVVGGAVMAKCDGLLEPGMAWTAAVSAALLAGVLGAWLYQAGVAAQGGVLGFVLFAALAGAALGAVPHPGTTGGAIAFVLGVLGFVLGVGLGWKAAPALGIVQTVLYGALLCQAGILVLTRPESAQVPLILGITALVTVVPGVIVQWRDLRRD